MNPNTADKTKALLGELNPLESTGYLDCTSTSFECILEEEIIIGTVMESFCKTDKGYSPLLS